MIVRARLLAPPAVLLAALILAPQVQAAGDPAAGEKVFTRCKACHTNEKGKNRIGPSLFGVVGRTSGTAEAFSYSDAMKNAKVTWTPENLDKYLSDPKAFVPGNKMAFPGVKDPTERADVIAYLQTLK